MTTPVDVTAELRRLRETYEPVRDHEFIGWSGAETADHDVIFTPTVTHGATPNP